MFQDAEARAIRENQYYELQGNRACMSGPWKIVSLKTPDKDIGLDNWMLFELAEDPAEIGWAAGNEGLICALGDRFCGRVVFVEDAVQSRMRAQAKQSPLKALPAHRGGIN